jgi:hypothetical protein
MCKRALEESGLRCHTIVQLLITVIWTRAQTLSPILSSLTPWNSTKGGRFCMIGGGKLQGMPQDKLMGHA